MGQTRKKMIFQNILLFLHNYIIYDMNKISFWFNNARTVALPQSLLPTFAAISISAISPAFSWLAAVICVLGVIFCHLGMNLADDWFDYKEDSAEVRKKHASEGIRARMVKYPYLTSGEATPRQLFIVSTIFLLIAALCGIIVAIIRGWDILWWVLAGFIVGMSYSGKPLKLGFRGLGELVIFTMFGPLLMTGIYYACTGSMSNELILMSVSIGLLVTNIIYSHSVMDAEHDIKFGKRTMAHVMGSKRGQLILSGIFNLLPYFVVIIGICIGWIHWAYIFCFITLPLSIWLVRSISDFIYERPVEIKTEPWMGPMGNFERYKAAKIDWFMLRWLTSRNIVSFFSFIVVIVSIILAIVY